MPSARRDQGTSLHRGMRAGAKAGAAWIGDDVPSHLSAHYNLPLKSNQITECLLLCCFLRELEQEEENT